MPRVVELKGVGFGVAPRKGVSAAVGCSGLILRTPEIGRQSSQSAGGWALVCG
jgi:hypothetical protein